MREDAKQQPGAEVGHEAEEGEGVVSKHFSPRQILTDISKLLLVALQGVDPEVGEVSLVEKVAVEAEKANVPSSYRLSQARSSKAYKRKQRLLSSTRNTRTLSNMLCRL